MKRKIFSVLLTLVLVLSLSLMLAAPVMAGNPTIVLTTAGGGIDSLTGTPTGSGTEAGSHSIAVTGATASTATGDDAEGATANTIATAIETGTSDTFTATIAGEDVSVTLAAATAGTTTLTAVAADIQSKINDATTVADVAVTVAGVTDAQYFVITVNLAGANNSITAIGGTAATPTGFGTPTLGPGTDADAVDTFTAADGSNGLWVTANPGSTKTIAHTTTAGTASTLAGLEALVEVADAFIEGITITAESALAAGTATITVSAGTAGYLKVTGTASMTAGTTNALTVTAYDDADNRATMYTGDKNLIFSGPLAAPDGTIPTVTDKTPTAINMGSTTLVTFTSGVSTVGGVLTAYKAEATFVDVSDAAAVISSEDNVAWDLDLTVLHAAAANLRVTGTATMTAGTTNQLTITANDAYGNIADGANGATMYTGDKTITFSGPLAAPDGTVPTVTDKDAGVVNIGTGTTITFASGASTAGGGGLLTAYKAETPEVEVADTSIGSSGNAAWDLDLTVSPAAFAEYTVVPANTSQVAGTAFTVTITAVDQFQNTDPSGIIDSTLNSYTFAFSGPIDAPDDTAPTYPITPSFSGGVWTATNGVTLVKAQTVALIVADTTTLFSGTSDSITVNNALHAAYTVVPAAFTQTTVGTSFNVDITAVDEFENAAIGIKATLDAYDFIFSGPSIAPDRTTNPTAAGVNIGDTVAAATMSVFDDATGVSTVPVTLVRGEVVALTATDTTTSFSGTSASITVFKVLVLNDGWTLISTDREIDADLSAWVGTTPSPIYKYTGVSFASVTLADLRPADALYVKTVGGGEVKITSSAMAGVSSKSLVAGWNLISSGTGADNNAQAVLSPLHYIDVGEEQGVGLATLVSQGNYNLSSASWGIDVTAWANLSAITLNPFDGYWVYMNAAKSCFGVVSD